MPGPQVPACFGFTIMDFFLIFFPILNFFFPMRPLISGATVLPKTPHNSFSLPNWENGVPFCTTSCNEALFFFSWVPAIFGKGIELSYRDGVGSHTSQCYAGNTFWASVHWASRHLGIIYPWYPIYSILGTMGSKIPMTPIGGRFCEENFLRYLDSCFAIPANHKLKTFPLL